MPGRAADHVDEERLWRRIHGLAEFGAREDGGVNRPALSRAEAAARAELASWGRAAGLVPYTDALANLFLRSDCADPDSAPVVVGSHIDSQPTGGRFDGAYGVLAGLEAIEAIRAAGLRPRRAIEVVAWTNEEGSRFAPGMTGSSGYVGAMPLEDIRNAIDSDGVSAGDALAFILSGDRKTPQRALGRPFQAYVEPHIEQGTTLERAAIPVGIVSGIQGVRRYRVCVTGEAAHAGTTRRADRRDALMAATRMVREMDEVAAAEPEDLMFTVGMLRVAPNAPSVVPEEAYFSIDVRHPDDHVVERMDAEVARIVEARKAPCSASVRRIAHAPSITFDTGIQALLRSSADRAQVRWMEAYSPAGHDARQLNGFCPTGMLFVPCRGGVSHNPAEWAEKADLGDGVRALTEALVELAQCSA